MLLGGLLIPLLASVLIVDLVAITLVWRSALQRQEILVAGLTQRVSLLLENSGRMLQSAASSTGSQDVLDYLIRAEPQFQRIYRTDTVGRLVEMAPADGRYLGADFSNQPFTSLALDVEGLAYSASQTSPLSGNQTLYLVAGLPDGGRLAAELRLDQLNETLAHSLAVEHAASAVMLADPPGNRLAGVGQVNWPQEGIPLSGDGGMRLVLGRLVLSSTVSLQPSGWQIKVETPLLANLGGYLLGILGLLLLVPVASMLVMLRFGRKLNRSVTQPLALLNDRTQQLTQGDYSNWISFQTITTGFLEVAELANSFQRLQRAIQERQAALQVSEMRFREMAELLPDMLFELDATRRIRYANRAALRLLSEGEPGQLFDRLLAQNEVVNLQEMTRQAATGQSPHPQVLRFSRANGATFPGELVLEALRGRDGSLLGYRGVVRDITDRLAFEETLRRSYQLFTEGPVVVFRVRASGEERPVEYVSPNISQYGYRPHDFISRPEFYLQIVHPQDRERITRTKTDKVSGGARFYEQEYRVICAGGEMRWVYDFTSVNRDANGQPTHFDWYLLDITERKRAEERINAQLNRLKALQMVDVSITANAELSLTLQILIAQLVDLLSVDAAVVLRYNADLGLLEYAAGTGFNLQDPGDIRLRLGESYAGQAALRREKVIIEDAPVELAGGFKYAMLQEENFVSYYALPLVAKGEIKGVLEIFNRTPLVYDREWMDFLETLAGQAAIAINNADLLANLQRTNEELREAYEATIRGLSQALEMRDRETEGHSQRVCDLAVRLARKAGVEEDQIEFVRIGALLHDIGKVGVPDGILHKEGPLDDAEWETMRKHPENARRMLQTIEYLRPALAIPQYHHERWNGSGYPYGLKEEDIPLTARVFAIVDVWDALSFDRPYRKAWGPDRVREYLNSESGILFDPALVKLFMDTLAEDRAAQQPFDMRIAKTLDTPSATG